MTPKAAGKRKARIIGTNPHHQQMMDEFARVYNEKNYHTSSREVLSAGITPQQVAHYTSSNGHRPKFLKTASINALRRFLAEHKVTVNEEAPKMEISFQMPIQRTLEYTMSVSLPYDQAIGPIVDLVESLGGSVTIAR